MIRKLGDFRLSQFSIPKNIAPMAIPMRLRNVTLNATYRESTYKYVALNSIISAGPLAYRTSGVSLLAMVGE